MSVFVVPPLEADESQRWPTLGPQVRQLIEDCAIHGPGDLRGQAPSIDGEKAALIDRMYQVYPREHPRAGRRRFKRVAISLRKGSAKTELAAWVLFAELHPDGPVRCDGWRREDGLWVPVGAPVRDPYIPLVAYTEKQTEELAYGALLCMCQEGPDADLFDAGFDRITRAYGDGKAEALATAPDSADGARTTCQHFDETHRMVLPRQKEARQTMKMNIPKRVIADAWEFETTTTYAPGEGSVAQDTHEYAELVAAGKARDASLFFFHREAPTREDEDLEDPAQIREAIRVASGPALAKWVDFDGQVDSIASLYMQPDTDRAYWERVWLNRRRQAARQAFSLARWRDLVRPGFVIPDGDPVTAGFDGSRWRDATALVVTDIDGFQHAFKIWEHDGSEDWEVPEGEVDAAVAEIARRWHLVRLYGDPAQGWDVGLARWSGKLGPKRVAAFYTDSRNARRTGTMFRAYHSAIRGGDLAHDGDRVMAEHIGNACKRLLPAVDEDGTPLWTIEKERRDSPKKIDYAMAAGLSWQARLDAIAAKEMVRRARRKLIVMA